MCIVITAVFGEVEILMWHFQWFSGYLHNNTVLKSIVVPDKLGVKITNKIKLLMYSKDFCFTYLHTV